VLGHELRREAQKGLFFLDKFEQKSFELLRALFKLIFQFCL
jgi:hypothetical protein